jgi:hypothetical protein
MRYFTMLDFQTVVLSLFLSLVVTILLYIAFGSAASTRNKKKHEGSLKEYPEGLQLAENPIPPLITFILVAFVVWAVVYLVVVGLHGGPF